MLKVLLKLKKGDNRSVQKGGIVPITMAQFSVSTKKLFSIKPLEIP